MSTNPSAVQNSLPRILLVEDNEDDQVLAMHAIRSTGVACDVDVARDGEEAIARLQTRDPTRALPVLVLLDLNLPKLDGLEVLRRLRSDPRTRHIPVVALTSSRESQDVLRAYQLGANGYVRKPIDFDEFRECARAILAHWIRLNVLPPPVSR
jgi:two-component system response regulator